MNIIETVKQILTDCPVMPEFTNDIHVDFTENTDGNFGVYSNGDAILQEDLIGNQTRRHSFVLYAHNQAISDYERLENSSFLLNLGYWLETVKDVEITADVGDKQKKGKLKKITCANGMLYDVPDGDVNAPMTYQLQIYANYTLESEGF